MNIQKILLAFSLCLILFYPNQPKAQDTLAAEDIAAIDLFMSSLGGGSTSNPIGWASDIPNPWILTGGTYNEIPASGWYGVTFVQDFSTPNLYRIKSIDLSNLVSDLNAAGSTSSGLFGNLPYMIFQNMGLGSGLAALTYLDLSNNPGLNEPINLLEPDSSFHTLLLNNCNFSYSSSLFYYLLGDPYSPIRRLEISNTINQSGIPSPLELGGITSTSLDTFIARGNNFNDTLNLASLPARYIDLSDNQLQYISIQTSSPTPEYLSLNDNSLTSLGEIDNILSNLSTLKYLYADNALDTSNNQTHNLTLLSNNILSNTIIELSLKDNNIDGVLDVAYFEQVKSLDCRQNRIQTLSYNGTTGTTRLKKLYLSDNNIEGNIPVALFDDADLQLERLYLSNNKIGGKFPKPAGSVYLGADNLQYLHVDGNKMGKDLELTFFENSLDTIKEFNIKDNKFDNVITSATLLSNNNLGDQLDSLIIYDNEFAFNDLYKIVQTFNLASINLTSSAGTNVQHYAPLGAQVSNGNPEPFKAFRYSPQDSIGTGGTRRRAPGERIEINYQVGPNVTNDNEYFWVRQNQDSSVREGLKQVTIIGTQTFGFLNRIDHDGSESNESLNFFSGTNNSISFPSIAIAANNDKGELYFPNPDASHGTLDDKWEYILYAKNAAFPLLTIASKPKRVIVQECQDSTGGSIPCQQIIARYDAGFAGLNKAELREEIGVTVIDSCVCGDVELWSISDTTFQRMLELEANGKGTKTTATQNSTKLGLLSADPNYTLLGDTTGTSTSVTTPAGNTNPDAVRVAIIDSGVDYDHPNLTNHIIPNDLSAVDSCRLNGFGYNFLNPLDYPFDEHGHGTQIAGIIAGQSDNTELPSFSGNTDDVAILPFKYTDASGSGSLFHAVCGIYYAAENGAKVINASWGYWGDSCKTLEDAIAYVDANNTALFITSVGNDSVDVIDGAWDGNSSLGLNIGEKHWPSSSIHLHNNVIAVAALDNTNSDSLARYSNFGKLVSIAADGYFETTDIDTVVNSSGRKGDYFGTSFATAQISRAAALLMYEYPDATICAVKGAILNGSDTLTGIRTGQDIGGVDPDGLGEVPVNRKFNYEKARQVLESNPYRTECTDDTYAWTGIDRLSENTETWDDYIRVYPNPFQNQLVLEFLTPNQILELEIIDVSGRKLYQQSIEFGTEQLSLSTEQWAAGVYFVKLKTQTDYTSYKLIKQ
ncbi:MAG: S8 family serine peptidase [Saprospiraceae bacterium]|nr:S8 family serine peptidase [Saprospiraceae bacterium]